jgi:hypothetical protein
MKRGIVASPDEAIRAIGRSPQEAARVMQMVRSVKDAGAAYCEAEVLPVEGTRLASNLRRENRDRRIFTRPLRRFAQSRMASLRPTGPASRYLEWRIRIA